MRHRRLPAELWAETRIHVLRRYHFRCQKCHRKVAEDTAHIDHITPLAVFGSNHFKNLRPLCQRCHSLRVDKHHRGMMAAALRKGWITAEDLKNERW